MAKTVEEDDIAVNQCRLTIFNIAKVSHFTGCVAEKGNNIEVILLLFFAKNSTQEPFFLFIDVPAKTYRD
ncbi:hypothetical protein SB00610_02531 [Klebsiella quasipneumoniae subsp. similipneumoniae]|nr:hypothetical protein SB00610_02531 [Klebsiella quasipneumoniae subsp. similipneumoniae]